MCIFTDSAPSQVSFFVELIGAGSKAVILATWKSNQDSKPPLLVFRTIALPFVNGKAMAFGASGTNHKW